MNRRFFSTIALMLALAFGTGALAFGAIAANVPKPRACAELSALERAQTRRCVVAAYRALGE